MSILALWLPILLLTSTTISVLIWLVQRITFQFARERGLLAALIFVSIRTVSANEVDGPVVFGMIIFIQLVGFTLILSILFNVVTAIFIWWRHQRR